MKTLWDLIYQWRGLKADAERIETQARKTRQEADKLEAQLRDALVEHGPVKDTDHLYLPPENPHDPIRILTVQEAIEIALKPKEEEGGGAV